MAVTAEQVALGEFGRDALLASTEQLRDGLKLVAWVTVMPVEIERPHIGPATGFATATPMTFGVNECGSAFAAAISTFFRFHST